MAEVTIIDRLRRLATVSGSAGLDASRLLLDAVPASELEWSDFEHIAEGRDHIEGLLRGTLEKAEPGVNILLYGPPGTGKTEFCKVLAERLGVTLYGVGEADDDGDEPSRGERLQELRLAQRLLAGDRRSLLLFDEMQDLLSDSVSGGLSLFGQPFSRQRPGRRLRGVHAQAAGAGAGTDTLDHERCPFGQRDDSATHDVRAGAAPADDGGEETGLGPAAGAPRHRGRARRRGACPGAGVFRDTRGWRPAPPRAARISGGGIDTVRRGVHGLSRLLSCEVAHKGAPPLFDPALIKADTDAVVLADSLVGSGEQHFSLCLQGPPGTGKSAVRPLPGRA